MDAFKLPFTFDVEKIKRELSQFNPEDYYDIWNPSVTTETLWSKHFIEPIGFTHNGHPNFQPNEALKKCPYLLSVLETFKCNKETFRVHFLEGGAHIKPHKDIGYCLEQGLIRLHIPIQTNEKVELLVNGNLIKMKEGECWYCNFNETHEVHNYSDKPRIHLIMDCKVNDWVKEIFDLYLI